MGSLANHNNGVNDDISVIVVPFPAQGHLNQMLQLSCLISSYGIPVYYAASAVHNRQAKLRVNGLNPSDVASIHFHDLPSPAQTTSLLGAIKSMREPLGEFMRSLSEMHRRVVVIHDQLIASVIQDVNLISNLESYAFNCLSAYFEVKFVFEQIIGRECPVQRLRELPLTATTIFDDMHDFIALQNQALSYKSGDLYNTCRLMEAPFLEILESEEVAGKLKSWAIGPLIPAKVSEKSNNKILTWLDKQEAKSVVYVSFGTTTTFTEEQIDVLATGLERSGQKFVWVLRDADKENVFDGEARRVELPPGFEDRVNGRGMVVRDWAPQPEILAHPPTGVFMSHCGWNSCIESIMMGVPIAAWPVHSDQPTNAVLVTEVLKIGLPMRRWGEVVTAAIVEDVVRRLVSSEEGGKIRERVEELAALVRAATEKGGASRVEMDSFISHITRQD